MAKENSREYILGMITGASLMLALWACTGNELLAESGDGNDDIQKVEIVNSSHYSPIYVDVVNSSLDPVNVTISE